MFNYTRFILLRYQRKTRDEMFSYCISSNAIEYEEYINMGEKAYRACCGQRAK